MDTDRWQRLRALFDDAVEIDAAQRAAFVQAQCRVRGFDAEMQEELLALLGALDDDTTQPAAPIWQAAPDLLAKMEDDAGARERKAMLGRRIGVWRVQDSIGSGGMGSVYLVERADGDFRQQGALKLIRAGWDADQLLERFRAERRILAGLNHPGIASLLDGGETDDGAPYLVMEYVDGQAIGSYCDARQLGINERLRLFLAVADAVAHAHRNLVVHRDLKPSNILVDRDGRVKLLDFGIAKFLERDAESTGTGQRLFTPGYAAPEQVRGEPVTTSVDIHALGLLLYTLLTGRRAYGKTASTPAAYEHAVLSQLPTRPSHSAIDDDEEAERLAHARQLSPARLGAALRGDLDAIVMKALRKEPDERYPSVDAMRADVERHLAHEPVQARRGDLRYRMRRFVRRHALAVSLSALALVSLLLGLGAALWQAHQAELARQHAQRQATIAQAVADFMTNTFALADPAKASVRDPSARHLLDRGLQRIDEQSDLDRNTRAALLHAIGLAYSSLHDRAKAYEVLLHAAQHVDAGADPATQVRMQLALGNTLSNLGRGNEGLEHLHEARRLFDQAALQDASLRATLDSRTSIILLNLRRHAEALDPARRAYTYLRQHHGIASEQVSVMFSAYIGVLVANDLQDEALDVARETWGAAMAQKGLDFVHLGNFADAYGQALLRAGHHEEAETVYREQLALFNNIYGVGHLATATAFNNVAAAMQWQERHREAGDMFEELVAIRRNPEAAPVKLAEALLSAGLTREREGGRDDQAFALLEEGLEVWRESGASFSSRYLLGVLFAIRIQERRGELELALHRNLELQPFLDGDLHHQGADYAFLILLQRARLEHRLQRGSMECAVLQAIVENPKINPVARTEARVLAADCLAAQQQPEAAHALLMQIAPDDPTLAQINDYTRRLHDEMMNAMAEEKTSQ